MPDAFLRTEVLSRARMAVAAAADWLTDVAAARQMDIQGRSLVLFGLAAAGEALRLRSYLEATDRTAAEVQSRSDELREDLAKGRFVTLLLASRALHSGSPHKSELERLCREGWLAAPEARAAMPPVIAWALSRLIDDRASGERPPLRWSRGLADGAFRYIATAELVRQMALEVLAAATFSEERTDIGDVASEVLDVFDFWMFCAIKEGDLDLVCPLARALRVLDGEGQAYRDGIDFVLDQQRRDGCFAMHDLASAISRHGDQAFDVFREMLLPMTVGSIWTLLPLARMERAP